MSLRRPTVLGLLAGAVLLAAGVRAQQPDPPPIELFLQAAHPDNGIADQALDRLKDAWRDSYTPLFIDMARLMRPAARPRFGADTGGGGPDFGDDEVGGGGGGGLPRTEFLEPSGPVRRESIIRERLIRFLERQTRKRFDQSLRGWREWMWTLPYEPHPDYARFKGIVFGQVDPKMMLFFPPGVTSKIRLDEIDWGGVVVNGIPPLVHPRVLKADEADYLKDNHVVFGIVVNGQARAYPKRILAWHEMATDRLGDVDLTVVYCTLCGTVIPYESNVGGVLRRFGTSGLLYRSNKLMFDEQTLSLWSTLEGKPVVGPLANTDLEMTAHPVVTTTWGEWRAQHPNTTVLSLDTGHERDYGEGVAYRDYFRTDQLYFAVPSSDSRLKNKAEVLTMRVKPPVGGEAQAVAIHADYLKRNPVHHLEVQGRRLLVVTSRQGANRVYQLGGHSVAFASRANDGRTIADTEGRKWRVTEEALVREDDPSVQLPRMPAQRAFWFGWYAQFPDTVLIK